MKQNRYPFKWRHFERTIILLCVRWYCRYQLSYRDVEDMMRERGLHADSMQITRLSFAGYRVPDAILRLIIIFATHPRVVHYGIIGNQFYLDFATSSLSAAYHKQRDPSPPPATSVRSLGENASEITELKAFSVVNSKGRFTLQI